MDRPTTVIVAIVLSTWLTANVSHAAKPNILLITSDDLGLQLGCYGDDTVPTPHLDRLAADGVRFPVAYVTQASCSPSRSSMFTGLYPHTNGQIGLTNANRGFQVQRAYQDATIPALLKKAGYTTALLGKLHVNPESAFPYDLRPKANARDVKALASEARKVFSRESDQPFFLMVNFTDPHAARTTPNGRDWYFPEQYRGLPQKPITAADVEPFPFQRLDDPEQLERVADYYNCVQRVDMGVGLILDALAEAGRDDDTLIIFVGDHGPPVARGKTTCYEGGLRVPFLVRWPGVAKPGQVSPAMVSTVDILPTILDAVGQAAPDGLQGHSLRTVCEQVDAPRRDYLAAEFHYHGAQPFFPRRAIRDDRYKLIHNLRAGDVKPTETIDGDLGTRLARQERYNGTPVQAAFARMTNPPEFELYDLESDPWEFENLADEPDMKETLARMKAALVEWRRSTDDPLLTEEGMKAFERGPQ
jgi:N-sulfoglucosamine sulfohydrolase